MANPQEISSGKMGDFEEISFQDADIIENPFVDPSVSEASHLNLESIKLMEYDPYNSSMSSVGMERSFEDKSNLDRSNAEKNKPSPVLELGRTLVANQMSKSRRDIDIEASKPLLNTEELLKKQEELLKKEEELAKKEEQIRRTATNLRQNNWPPLPEKCCFQPCFYQDIEVEIPLEFQVIVKKLYKMWIFHEAIMIFNVVCGILLLNFAVIGLGVLYFLLYTPFSYLCWFRPVYKAFRSDSSINFMVFFIMFFLQFVITIMQAIGAPGSGTIGVVTAFQSFSGSRWGIFTGLLAVLLAVGFCTAAVCDFILISKVHKIYRCTGASFAKAQAEFSTQFLTATSGVRAGYTQ